MRSLVLFLCSLDRLIPVRRALTIVATTNDRGVFVCLHMQLLLKCACAFSKDTHLPFNSLSQCTIWWPVVALPNLQLKAVPAHPSHSHQSATLSAENPDHLAAPTLSIIACLSYISGSSSPTPVMAMPDCGVPPPSSPGTQNRGLTAA